MSIFQKSVINKYLKNLDSSKVAQAYKSYQTTFTADKIVTIKTLKEEEYQDGFLRDLFVNSLGYTLKPDTDFNLVREKKNETDAKKADGAIVREDKVIAVIELKDTKTKDMGSITDQAFGYKNSHEGCKFVVTSNFHKLRFYIDNKVDFEEFNLFELSRDDFELLYLILSKDSVFSDLPSKLKSETKFHEENISNKLYKDYSVFKRKLYDNMVKNAPEYDRQTLFKKSQKLLDRYLFILFAEDRGLLPPNSISRIISRFDILKSEDAYKPLYDICRQFFGYLNTGNAKEGIPAYNGGLFLPDDILDNLKIDDDILRNDLYTLSTYDFDTEIDVNILGHIFEHSLSEIEEITAEIEGVKSDKAKSKRKKDGVYYTPKYITQYIVENTVGTLCREKRIQLDIAQIEFDEMTYRKASGFLTEKGKTLFDKLEAYKNWLITLKIVDPACGSGAFLNQALNFLIQEHKTIDDIIAELTNSPLRLFDTDKAILENNLYGVDINDESVEIAKLSLWLHTARKDRKLSDLNNNIKCGNSLIDDPAVAGDKAFNWHKEFPDIMHNGGFDVVIGNPPYVRVQSLSHSEIDWFKSHKKIAYKRIDISLLFFETAHEILKPKGLLSFITSNQFLNTEYGRNARKFILNNFCINSIVDFGDLPVFVDALTYVSVFTLKKDISKDFKYIKIDSLEKAKSLEFNNTLTIDVSKLNECTWVLTSDFENNILTKINSYPNLEEIAKCHYGIVTGNDDIFILEQKDIEKHSIEKEVVLPLLRAENCFRYGFSDWNKYVIYPFKHENNKTVLMDIEDIKEKYPNLYKYLIENKNVLLKRKDSRKTFENNPNWHTLTRFGQLDVFKSEKIVYPGETKRNKFGIDCNKAGYSGARVFAITIRDSLVSIHYLLALLNSKLLEFYLHSQSSLKQGGYYSYSSSIIDKIPIPRINEQQPFIDLVQKILELNKQLQEKANKFHSRIKSNFAIEKLNTKLESFYEHEFKTFVAELKKQKISLTLKQQDEWEEYFNEYKKEINDLQAEIKKTDAEIDQMVYKLYELTDEEIRIVEGSV